MPVHDLTDTRSISEAGLRAIPILMLGPMFEFGANFQTADLNLDQRVRAEAVEGLERRGIARFEIVDCPWQNWKCRKAILTARGRMLALALSSPQ